MPIWTEDSLAEVEKAEELAIASRRSDGSLRPYVTIWVVRVNDEIYVRSAAGPDNPWFRRALASAEGRIRAGGIEQDVAFEVPAPEVAASVTAAYHATYDRYGPSIVGTVVSAQAVASTLRLVPRARWPTSGMGVVGTLGAAPLPNGRPARYGRSRSHLNE